MDHVERLLTHTGFMRALALSLVGDAARADDVVQDALVAALEHRPRDPARMRSWLGKIVRNFAFRSHRTEKRRDRHEGAAPPRPPVPSADEILARENARRRVVGAVLKLPEPYRAAVILRYLEELPPRDVARRLGIPVETVRTRVKRALAQLRETLDAEYGGDRRAWSLALVPFLVPAPASAGALAGVLLMSTKAKVATAAAVAFLAVVVAVWNPFERASERAPVERRDRRTTREAATEPAPPPASAPEHGADEGHAPAADSAPKAVGVIRGRVVADGKPLAGAYVALHLGDERLARVFGTGADGGFEFERTGTFEIRAAHPARRPASAEVTVAAGDVADVVLELPAAPHVDVRVVDAATGAPVPDAELLLVRTLGEERGRNAAVEQAFADGLKSEEGWYGMARRFAAFTDPMGLVNVLKDDATALYAPALHTDAQGRARLGGLLPGPFELIVSHADYPSALATGTAGDEDVALEVRLNPGTTLTVVAPQFSGNVCELDTATLFSLPVARATFDEEGHAVFDRLRPGTYSLVVSRHGTWEINLSKVTEDGPDGQPVEKSAMSVGRTAGAAQLKRNVTVEAGEDNVLDLSALEGATIRGRVVGAEGPWLVTLLAGERERASTGSDEAGAFEFRNVPPGEYRVAATQQAAGTTIEAVCTVARGADEVQVVVRAARGVVTGLVLGPDEQPAAGAALFALPVERAAIQEPRSVDELMGFLIGHAETDEAGRFRIEHVPAGKFFLFCGHGRALARHELELGTDEERRVDFRLAPVHLHRVTIALTGGAGDPVAGHVVVRGAHGGLLTAFVLDADVFSPDGAPATTVSYQLAGGRYFVDVYAEGLATRRGVVIDVNGEEHETIRLGPGVPVHLTLEGAPETRVEVRDARGLRLPRGETPLDALLNEPGWRTDAAGQVTLPRVAPGDYTVHVEGKEVGRFHVARTEVRERFRLR
jgi:RNA polymerase sigma-70 factor (ECF subfamily)